MAFDGTDKCWRPASAFQVDYTPRIQKALFGDGYQQRAIDGINSLGRSWSLTFQERDTVLRAMVNYLAALKGASFDFLEPESGEMVSVFCDKWSVSWALKNWSLAGTGQGNYSRQFVGQLTAEFDEAFGAMTLV